ncbi:MAG TPA: homocysteine S-methyltransferase [Jiangellales bacterium]|nr:homocysteine S-methyltransferase [Jiangellales bacterium]
MDLAALMAERPIVLDGGLATELERQGQDLSDDLWSARLLRDDPAAVVEAHLAFLRAGAEVSTTASYQASVQGFAAAGIDARGTRLLLHRSVELAREAGERYAAETGRPPGLVAASVGPYGAVLADGSEYRGDYGLDVAELRAFHRPRLEWLAEAGPDVLACETVPCLAEAEALLAEVADLGVLAWLSLTVDGERTRLGEPAAEAFLMARDVASVVAVGVNCCDPGDLAPALVDAVSRSGRPAVAYPNSGEAWDGMARRWLGEPGFRPGAVRSWLAAGARLVGGCCRVGPERIAAVAAEVAAVG